MLRLSSTSSLQPHNILELTQLRWAPNSGPVMRSAGPERCLLPLIPNKQPTVLCPISLTCKQTYMRVDRPVHRSGNNGDLIALQASLTGHFPAVLDRFPMFMGVFTLTPCLFLFFTSVSFYAAHISSDNVTTSSHVHVILF